MPSSEFIVGDVEMDSKPLIGRTSDIEGVARLLDRFDKTVVTGSFGVGRHALAHRVSHGAASRIPVVDVAADDLSLAVDEPSPKLIVSSCSSAPRGAGLYVVEPLADESAMELFIAEFQRHGGATDDETRRVLGRLLPRFQGLPRLLIEAAATGATVSLQFLESQSHGDVARALVPTSELSQWWSGLDTATRERARAVVHTGQCVSVAAIAAALGLEPPDAARELASLVRAGVVLRTGDDHLFRVAPATWSNLDPVRDRLSGAAERIDAVFDHHEARLDGESWRRAYGALGELRGAARQALSSSVLADDATVARWVWALRWHFFLEGSDDDESMALLRLCERLEGSELARASAVLGALQITHRQFDRGLDRLARSNAHALREEDAPLRSYVSLMLGIGTARKDVGAARERFEPLREARSPIVRALALERLAFCALAEFRLTEARQYVSQAGQAFAGFDVPAVRAQLLLADGFLTLRAGDYPGAISMFEQAGSLEADEQRADLARFNAVVTSWFAGRDDADAALGDIVSRLDARRADLGCLARLYRWVSAVGRGEYDVARTIVTEVLKSFRRASSPHLEGLVRGALNTTTWLETDQETNVAHELRDALALTSPVHAPELVGLYRYAHALMDPDSVSHHARYFESLQRQIPDEDHHHRRLVRYFIGRLRGDEQLPDAPAHVRAFLDRLGRPSASHATWESTMLVHRGGQWFRIDDGEPVDLMTRRPLRFLLGAFVEQAEDPAGRGLDVDDLIAAGWPGERVGRKAGANRVYTAIRFLRDHGLEDVIVTTDDGYRISPSVRVIGTDESIPRR